MKKMRMIAVMVLLGMMLSLAGCGGSDGTNGSSGNNPSGGIGEAVWPEISAGAQPKLTIQNGISNQVLVSGYYVLEQAFWAVNDTEDEIKLSDYVQKDYLENRYNVRPLDAFEDNAVKSKTVQAQSSAGWLPCIVAYDGEEILQPGERRSVSICVKIPQNVTEAMFWTQGGKIGTAQCGKKFVLIEDDPQKPVKNIGETITLLQVEATASAINVTDNQIQYMMEIKNQRTNALPVILSNFKVVVKDADGNEIAKINSTNGMTCDASLLDTNLKKENSVKGRITVELQEKLKAGDQVVLTYVPDHEYSEYSMSWQYTCTK